MPPNGHGPAFWSVAALVKTGHASVPIKRKRRLGDRGYAADERMADRLVADMMRPWGKPGRDSLACRLVGRSLPHGSNYIQAGRFCQLRIGFRDTYAMVEEQ